MLCALRVSTSVPFITRAMLKHSKASEQMLLGVSIALYFIGLCCRLPNQNSYSYCSYIIATHYYDNCYLASYYS